MNKEKIYNNTVDILLDAYLNETLEHSNCYACACGNIAAAANNLRYKKGEPANVTGQTLYWENFRPYGTGVEYTMAENNPIWYGYLYGGKNEDGLKQIHSTGYTVEEFVRIEKAFEFCPSSLDKKEHMFNGLTAVLDVLREIHKVDMEESNTNQEKLTNIYKNKLELV